MSLTPETEAFIAGRVASGCRRSAGEAVHAAVRRPEEDGRRDRAGERRVGR